MRHYDEFPLDGTIDQDIVCFHHLDYFHDSPFHKHDEHIELYLFLQGDVDYFTRKMSFPLSKGDLIAVPAGVWHRAYTLSKQTYERIFINIRTRKIRELSTPLTDLMACFKPKISTKDVNVIKLNKNEQTNFIGLCHQVIATMGQKGYGIDVQLNTLQARILLMVNLAFKGRKMENVNNHPERIHKILDYIDTNLSGNLRLDAIADSFFLNPDYLNRYFRKEMGLSLHTYIKEVRLQKARYLLQNGESISETADNVGYDNYSSFIRAFTKQVGTSPSKFKKIYFEDKKH